MSVIPPEAPAPQRAERRPRDVGASPIGVNVPRREARDKVRGAARYVDDVTLPGMIHGVTVRSGESHGSSAPRGRIRRVLFDPAIPWAEITIVTAKDLPGPNLIALIRDDQPCLVDEVYNHPEEPVLLLAHADPQLLNRARAAIRFEVDPLPAVLTIEDAEAARDVVWGADNVLYRVAIDKGDPDAAFAAAVAGGARVFTGEYRTAAQEQLYIENNGMIAVASAESGVTVWGSLQCPYYVQKALIKLFDLTPERARVVQLTTGGGFGGKEEYPSILAAHAALLAWKSGRPVKMIYDRGEDMAATTKRHPSRTRLRSAVSPDGRLLAQDIDFAIDGGAYATLSQVVLSRGSIHAAGPYACDHVRVRGRALATSSPPHGAFRGFGAPQSIFAMERHLDEIAHALSLAPEELRRRNLLQRGGTLATGQVLDDPGLDLQRLLDRGLRESDYHARRRRFAEENARPGQTLRRGMGLCTFLHGTGFTGSGEKHLASLVTVEGAADGRVRVLTSSTEIGQGTQTVFAQIAAAALGVGVDDIEVAATDTRDVPDSGPTVASRTCTIVGKLVQDAATTLRQTLLDSGLLQPNHDGAALREAVRRHLRELGPLCATTRYQQPASLSWDEARFRGDAYGAYSYAVYVAQVCVDLCTYEARVEDFVALQEVGRVIHPLLAAGQIEGGVAQGVGWALYEDCVWKDGRMANNRMTDYIIPTAADIPPIRVFFEDGYYPHGAFGAKGIGELPMDGPAPAILNAIHDALGVSVRQVPATPEVIFAALRAEAAHGA